MTETTDDGGGSDARGGACTAAFRGLAQGNYDVWHGLTESCSTDDVVAALGADRGADLVGSLGGSPTRYRIYAATDAAPHGIYVWDVDDQIVLVRIHDARPAAPIVDQLGEAEATAISRMPGFKTQWIYASRGLTLHIDDDTGAVAWLYGYRPMSVGDFLASWISQVEIKRTPSR